MTELETLMAVIEAGKALLSINPKDREKIKDIDKIATKAYQGLVMLKQYEK